MTVTQMPFLLRAIAGSVTVELVRNDDPARWGYELLRPSVPLEDLAGFPVCTATVTYPGEGYAAMLGWVQFVKSTDSDGEPSTFELDPISIYERVSTPFAWFGVKPTLFDAPSREAHYPMRWRARSFLCATPDAIISQAVQPVLAFEWGFDRDEKVTTVVGASQLGLDSWSDHLPTLRQRFPEWTFLTPPAGG